MKVHKPDQTDIVRISDQKWIDAGKKPLPSWMVGATQYDQNMIEAMWSQTQGAFERGLSTTQMEHLFSIARRSKDVEINYIRNVVKNHRRHVQGHCVVCVYDEWPCATYTKALSGEDAADENT